MPAAHDYPRLIPLGEVTFELRLMGPDDAAAVLAFAAGMPHHDLLFLQRDIRNPRVVAAWIDQIAAGNIVTVLAVRDGRVQGCAAIVRDGLSWSPHVGECRVVVAPDARGHGLGREITQDALALSLSLGIEKLLARMTPDQQGAIAVFEELGFHPEALFRDYVRDDSGASHDLVILSLDLVRHRAQLEAFGFSEV
ncbi:GNAT family N-acetyltransferase [Sphingomonas profundi]|uniref:GNAT family N-acetyltransferase n=1 Tax=Alterirhizorhabdus profundi TaxID=2681549 RepID=UPI0012E91927|nr:GNAT family N-acetyltransferase [Sphingomonas profundi]